MAKEGDYTISNIYQGGYSSFNPGSNYITTGSLGLTTDPRTANVLKDVSNKLASGVKQIELEFVSPEIFDSIPKQQLEEVKRISKLTGVDVSVHGPVVDTVGMTQQGFNELNREASEKRFIQTVERSHELNPEGNISVNFHSAEGIPGTEHEITPSGKKVKKLIVVNQESGQMAPLTSEKRHYPIMVDEKGKLIPVEKGEILSPERELKILNNTEWTNSLTKVEEYRKHADEVMRGASAQLTPLLTEHKKGETPKITTQEQASAIQQLQQADVFLSNVESSFNAIYDKAYKYSDEKAKRELKNLSDEWIKDNEQMRKEVNELNYPILRSQLLSKAITNINKIYNENPAPQLFVPIEEFATKQSSKTFGNTAFKSYKKFGDKSPIINIENPPAGFALSTGEDLKNLVVKSREQFVERAKQEGLSESEAKRQAEKLIGATWDVGHINMLRKQGYEDKDIIKETEKIAPFVKHVHLSDNFGFEHTELPMGMGNTPIKEIMEKLGKKGFEAKKIIEAGHWWQHFQTPPVVETMEGLGSSMYSDGVGPYWNQTVGLQQGYLGGFGMMLPNINYQTFGAGFSQLPTELGGQMPGAQGSRMSGNPME